MNERRVLDAAHLRTIFLWVIRNKGEVREYQSGASETIISLACRDFPSVDIAISSRAIDMLAEQLRHHTVIGSSASPEALARTLTRIALVVNNAGPKVAGLDVNVKLITALVDKICAEFAVACAISFAESQHYRIERHKIPHNEASIALVMKDDDALTGMFGNALTSAPSGEGPVREANPAEPEYNAERDAEDLIRSFELRLADANPIPGPVSNYRRRQLSASSYGKLRLMAALDRLSSDELLGFIDEYMSPYTVDSDAADLIRYLEGQFANITASLVLGSESLERQVSATSYWNLRSVATLNGWSPDEVLTLIKEHLCPTLHPGFIHHSNTVSGPDWQRLYRWIFPARGSALWRLRIE